MTEFRKLLWMDADTLVLKNVDHLLKKRMFTAAFTVDCCNANSPAKPSGGLWVVEPSARVAADLQALMERPAPHGQDWHWGDMQLVRYLFSLPPDPAATQYLWPAVEDGRQGFVPGVRAYANFAALPDAGIRDYVRARAPGHEAAEGLLPGAWDGAHPAHVWTALDVTYDQCVGNCECMPERDSALGGMQRRRRRPPFFLLPRDNDASSLPALPPAVPTAMHTVHFSCMQSVDKPGRYASEADFMAAVAGRALSCTRFYMLHWYGVFSRALAGGLPAPKWTGAPVPVFDRAHDDAVVRARLAEHAAAAG
jgi:hypothetical protein